MLKFKIGDEVVRVTDDYLHGTSIVKGGIYIVSKVYIDGSIDLEGTAHSCYDPDCFELVDPVKKYKAMLFQSNSEQEATDIQMALFEAGYKWHSQGQAISYTSAKYFSANPDGTIFYMMDNAEKLMLPNLSSYTYHKLVEEKKLVIVEDVEKITYAGKLYNKKDFEAAISAAIANLISLGENNV